MNAVEHEYRQRLESLLAVDEGVAQVVEALRSAGELANTVLVFTSDNGFLHGEHRALLDRGKSLPVRAVRACAAGDPRAVAAEGACAIWSRTPTSHRPLPRSRRRLRAASSTAACCRR